MDMTSPVTVLTTPGQGPACKSDFLVSFFLPHKYQVRLQMICNRCLASHAIGGHVKGPCGFVDSNSTAFTMTAEPLQSGQICLLWLPGFDSST